MRRVLLAVWAPVIGLSVALIPSGVSVAADPACAAAFVTNYANDSVSTIDVETRTTHPTDITVGDAPSAVAITPDGRTAFVTNELGDSVSTIDVATRTKHPTDIPVGDAPSAVAITPDGTTAFVANFASGSVSTIDVATRAKDVPDINLGVGTGPDGIAITPDGTTAYVANALADSVSTIAVATRTKDVTDIDLGVGTGPFGVAITPDGAAAYVANFGSASVSTITVATRTKVVPDITVGATPTGVAITPDGAAAYVTNFGGNSVSTIAVATRTKDVTDIDLGVATTPTGVAITPDGAAAYVANFGNASVSTIEVATRAKHGTNVTVGTNPSGVAITPCTPPDPPTIGTATAGSSNATVRWTGPARDGGSAITGYTATAVGSLTTCAGAADATSCVVTGLTPGTNYTFTVVATNAVGPSDPSAASSPPVKPFRLPGAPGLVGATQTGGSGALSVSYAAIAQGGASAGYTNITRYTATCSAAGKPPKTAFDAAAPFTAITVTGMTNGATYLCRVSATNAAGTGALSAAASSRVGAPKPPASASVAKGTALASIKASWGSAVTFAGAPVTGFAGSCSAPGGVTRTFTGTPTTRSKVVTSLTRNKSYRCQVTAKNKYGTSVSRFSSNAVTPK